MKTQKETIVRKYERLRNSIPYVGYKGLRYFEQKASNNYAGLKLTIDERNEMVNSEAIRLQSIHNSEIKEYERKTNRLERAWIKALYSEFNVSRNPKADKCYSLAYEHGHSSGLSDVYNYFSEFVELIN